MYNKSDCLKEHKYHHVRINWTGQHLRHGFFPSLYAGWSAVTLSVSVDHRVNRYIPFNFLKSSDDFATASVV